MDSFPVMPFTILAVAELAPRDPASGAPAAFSRRLVLERDGAREALARLGLVADIAVSDVLGGRSAPLHVRLPLEDVRSFSPDAIAACIPAARDLLAVRARLAAYGEGAATREEVLAAIRNVSNPSEIIDAVQRALLDGTAEGDAPPEPADAPPAGEVSIEALLDSVDPGKPAGSGPLDDIVSALTRGAGERRIDRNTVNVALAVIDDGLTRQVSAVLHLDEVRRLEAAWRGVDFLLRRCDQRAGVRLELLVAPVEQPLEAFDALVFDPESRAISTTPLGLIAVLHDFGASPRDLATLTELARRAASLSAPVVAGAACGLLGAADAASVARATGLTGWTQREELADWRALRADDISRWLGLAFNRFLLRPDYARGTLEAKGFAFDEEVAGDGERVFGCAALAVAALAAASHARLGFATDMTGAGASGTIADLPVRAYERRGAATVAFPLETTISDGVERDMSAGGVMTLTGPIDGDRACLRFAAAAHVPYAYSDPLDKARARLQATLPFQLFVSRIVNYALLLESAVLAGRSAAEVQAGYDQGLRGLLGTAGAVAPDAVAVALPPNEDDPSRHDLALRVRCPAAGALRDAGHLELRWPLLG